jgi:monoamine oxidase
MAVTVNLEAPWETADAAVLDSQTLDSWPVPNTEDHLARRLLRLVVPGVFSAESPELSLLHFLFYVKSGTSLASLVATKGGAQDSRVVGGTHQISERMAAALGDRVRLGAVVRTIRHDDDVTVEYEGESIAGLKLHAIQRKWTDVRGIEYDVSRRFITVAELLTGSRAPTGG